jgi:arsenite methyltransferase
MNTAAEIPTSFSHDTRALAETYDRLSDMQFEMGKSLLQRLGPLEGAHVLDVGCGTGRLARWIAEQTGPSGGVVGVDPLPERVAIARAGAPRVRFEVGRAEDLSAFASETFDVVCMSAVLHWVTDKGRALGEVRRVLKPGGRAGVTTTPSELWAAGALYEVLGAVVSRTPYAERVRAADLALMPGQTTTELISMVIDSGLQLGEMNVTRSGWSGRSGREMVDFLESSSFGNFLLAVPDDLRDPLRRDLASAFDQRKRDDGIFVDVWLTLLVGTRM